MLVREMSRQECEELLARLSFGRLACARDNQPYIAPMYFAFDQGHLYGFATMGQKIAWMRLNPLVCVEADEVLSHNRWASVSFEEATKNIRTSRNTLTGGNRPNRRWRRSGLVGGTLQLQPPRPAQPSTPLSRHFIASMSKRSVVVVLHPILLKAAGPFLSRDCWVRDSPIQPWQ